MTGNLFYLADHTGLIHLYDYDPASGQVMREHTPGGSSSSSSSVGNGLRAVPQGRGRLGSGQSNDPSSDIIVEQTETIFDAASNAIQTTFRQRYHNATDAGPLTYPGGADPVARIIYVAIYRDPVGREQASVEIGVASGEFSKSILDIWEGRRLHLVDAWKHRPDYIDVVNETLKGMIYGIETAPLRGATCRGRFL